LGLVNGFVLSIFLEISTAITFTSKKCLRGKQIDKCRQKQYVYK